LLHIGQAGKQTVDGSAQILRGLIVVARQVLQALSKPSSEPWRLCWPSSCWLTANCS
jgi:hypothetical protein